MPRVVTHKQRGKKTWISKDEITNRVTDMAKPTRESDTKVCHAMNLRSTNNKGIQIDEV
jgi:hypothetical protein